MEKKLVAKLSATKEFATEKTLETPEDLLEEIGVILAAHDNRESSIDDDHDYWKYLAKYRLLVNP